MSKPRNRRERRAAKVEREQGGFVVRVPNQDEATVRMTNSLVRALMPHSQGPDWANKAAHACLFLLAACLSAIDDPKRRDAMIKELPIALNEMIRRNLEGAALISRDALALGGLEEALRIFGTELPDPTKTH